MLKNCLQHQACDYLITLIFIRLLWLSIVQIFPIESRANLLVFLYFFININLCWNVVYGIGFKLAINYTYLYSILMTFYCPDFPNWVTTFWSFHLIFFLSFGFFFAQSLYFFFCRNSFLLLGSSDVKGLRLVI